MFDGLDLYAQVYVNGKLAGEAQDAFVPAGIDVKGLLQAGKNELARFRAEADIIARLQHPNIVQIYDVGEVAGRPFFALEYVAGGSLAQHLDGTPQSARQAAHSTIALSQATRPSAVDRAFRRPAPAAAHFSAR